MNSESTQAIKTNIKDEIINKKSEPSNFLRMVFSVLVFSGFTVLGIAISFHLTQTLTF
ncbi:MAG: hypothetical protein QNJ54_03525 [Prochloraceae cyanobacterium]|nr:hypothetical protein [Prochloraceae cyanobacterium]